jgi:hypothetical protein
MSRAHKIIEHVMQTVCGYCEQEHRVPARPGTSHGVCWRHLVKMYRKLGKRDNEIAQKLSGIDRTALPPDLGRVEDSKSNAVKIVNRLLEDDPARSCADCEREHGILDRLDTSKSHGHCKRHFLEQFKTDPSISQEDIQSALAEMGESSFCPDLGPVQAHA